MRAKDGGDVSTDLSSGNAPRVGLENPTSTPKAESKQAIGGFAVHPLANEYPLMEELDPQAFERFVEDIKQNGLREEIDVIDGDDDASPIIIEGRNRALALERLGIKIDLAKHMRWQWFTSDEEIRAYVTSKNLHRRHLTKEWQDRINKSIADALKAAPEKSNQVIADEVSQKQRTTVNKKRVERRRKEMEARGTLSHVEKRTDSLGRQQPAKKASPRKRPEVTVGGRSVNSGELIHEVMFANTPKPPSAPIQESGELKVAMRDFCTFTIINIASGHLKLSGDPERYRKWRALKARVESLLKGRSS